MEIVLITGANKGIGYEVARQLAGRGMHVLVGSRDAGRGQAAVEALRAGGLATVEALEIDVTEQGSIDRAAESVMGNYGRVDVLINNAGIFVDYAAPSETPGESLRKTFDTNLFGAVAVTQAFLPLVRKGANPRIVNVSSGLGSLALHGPEQVYFPYNMLSYCASKAALNMFTVLLANELREDGIQVNTVDPGYTATDLNHNSGPQTVQEGSEAIVALATAAPGSGTGRLCGSAWDAALVSRTSRAV